MFKRIQFQRNADAATTGAGTTTLLSKGERVQLLDKTGGIMNLIHVGAGWDVHAGVSADLDLFAICLGKDGKLLSKTDLHKDVAYFGNKTLPGIQCGADNLTGDGEGDDENIQLTLDQVPADVDAILIGMNIYHGAEQHQTFGQVDNAFVRYADPKDITHDIKRFNLTEDYSTNTAILAAKVYRNEGGWKIQALGEGKNGSIQQLAEMFK